MASEFLTKIYILQSTPPPLAVKRCLRICWYFAKTTEPKCLRLTYNRLGENARLSLPNQCSADCIIKYWEATVDPGIMEHPKVLHNGLCRGKI